MLIKKYNVLTGLANCRPYRTDNYLKAAVACWYRKIKFGRGFILSSDRDGLRLQAGLSDRERSLLFSGVTAGFVAGYMTAAILILILLSACTAKAQKNDSTQYPAYWSRGSGYILNVNDVRADTLPAVMLVSDTTAKSSGPVYWRRGYVVRSRGLYTLYETYLGDDRAPLTGVIVWMAKSVGLVRVKAIGGYDYGE